jgi:integrase/recombinase XerD
VVMRARAANRPTLRAFAAWLEERGLCPGSVTVRVGSARSFVDDVTRGRKPLATRLRKVTADDVERFFVAYGNSHGKCARRSMQAALRLFLRFASQRGLASADLVDAVPSLRNYRLSGIPRGLGDCELSQALSCLEDSSARDRAILHVLATYGVRRQQISALCLQDIDWPGRRVTFAGHKCGKAITHVLTPLVAESLATYLHHERPAVGGDAVFLRSFAPHLRVGPACVTSLVRAAMERAGLPRRGPHALRHAFATRLLAKGQSLKTIADLLGHRSLSSVSIYAKVDYARLREVSDEWPEVRS